MNTELNQGAESTDS